MSTLRFRPGDIVKVTKNNADGSALRASQEVRIFNQKPELAGYSVGRLDAAEANWFISDEFLELITSKFEPGQLLEMAHDEHRYLRKNELLKVIKVSHLTVTVKREPEGTVTYDLVHTDVRVPAMPVVESVEALVLVYSDSGKLKLKQFNGRENLNKFVGEFVTARLDNRDDNAVFSIIQGTIEKDGL